LRTIQILTSTYECYVISYQLINMFIPAEVARFMKSIAIPLACLGLVAAKPALADEGMWTF